MSVQIANMSSSTINFVAISLLFFQVYVICNWSTATKYDVTEVTSSSSGSTIISDGHVRLTARLLAANVVKVTWFSTGDNATCNPYVGQLHAEVSMADAVTCINNSETLVSLRVVDVTNCRMTSCGEVGDSCVIGECDVDDSLPSCVVWDHRKRSSEGGYLLCVGLRRTTGSRRDLRWASNILRSQIRQPPWIEKCSIETNGDAGHRVVIKDMSVPAITVTLVDNDELRVWCEVFGSPAPRLSWYHNDVTYRGLVYNDTNALGIHGAKSQHSGKYILEAENRHGKSFSAVMSIQFAELQRFPNNELERKYTVKIGDGARLECRYLYRSHDLIFQWNKMTSVRDQHPIHVVPDDRVIIGLDGSLMFVNTISNDSGLYMCKVSNAVLDRSVLGSPLKLEIDSSGSPDFHRVPQLMWNSPKLMTALVGSDYTIQCVFSGKPTPQITWYTSQNGELIISESSHYRLSDGNHTLTIINATLRDQRTYSCGAVNSEGSNHPPIHLQLTVNESPRFTKRPTSLNATVGDTVTFHCSATGAPPPTINWQINGLSLSDSWWNYSTAGPEILIIHNVTLSHNFIVQCNVSNYLGVSIIASASLVVYLPTTITAPPYDVILSDDCHVVEFGCEVSSDPSTAVDILWLRGDGPVTVDGRRIYVSPVDQTLVINVTDEEDHGRSFIATYTCRVNNGLTADSRQARLRPYSRTLIGARRINDTLSATGSAATTWTWTLFGLYFDVTSLSCIFALLVVTIAMVTLVALLVRRRRHRKAKAIDEFRSLERMRSTPSESFEMRRWTRPTENKSSTSCVTDLVCENRLVVGLSALEDGQLKKALQSMYIPRDAILLGDTVGRGQFGRVYSASLRLDPRREQQVAVKTMKYKPEEKEMIEPFLHEAMMMRDFQHLNVLGIVGITFDPDGSPMVVLPYMANGDLRRYIMNADLDITVLRLLKMALQVGHGMTYLSEKRFVHRDLAARNCMVDLHGVVKVADFGLSRELILHDYYRLSHNRTPVPVRWMAPESLDLNVFTTMSDVWSFGVLMWELITRGAEPYTDIENWEVANYVKTGKRLPQPLYCPDSVYRIMMTCWRVEAHLRPTFTELSNDIEFIVNSANGQQPSASATRTNDDVAVVYSNHVDHPALGLLYRNSSAVDGAFLP